MGCRAAYSSCQKHCPVGPGPCHSSGASEAGYAGAQRRALDRPTPRSLQSAVLLALPVIGRQHLRYLSKDVRRIRWSQG